MKKSEQQVVILIGIVGFLFSLIPLIHSAERKPAWRAEWENTVQAAKMEGKLVVYGDNEITDPEILAAFNKEYPDIKVITVTGKEVRPRQRVVAERKAGKYLADLYAGGPNTPRGFYLAKFLDPIAPALLLPEVTDTSRWYGGKHLYADPENKYLFMFEGTPAGTSLSYNTKLVRPNEIKSYWDLLAPKWKGKILTWDPRASIPTQTLVLYYHPQVGPEYVRRFYGEINVTLFRDRRQGTDWLGRGKFPVCYFCRGLDRAKKQGLQVDVVSPDSLKETGGIGGGASSVLVLFNKAPHPNAARVFINWYLSRRGQMVWQRVMNAKIIEPSDSMRIDIPKDDVLPRGRRVENRKYKVIGYLNPKPVKKLLNEIVGEAQR